MKIAIVQFAPVLSNLKTTLQVLTPLLSKTKAAELIVLPELCNSGYNFRSKKHAWESAEEISKSKFIDFCCEAARKYNQYIVSGFNEKDNNDLYNTSVLIGPQGYIGRYRKLHLFMKEKDFFKPGNEGLPVFDIGICKLGMLVCFDWMFPEAWRVLALNGADVIAHPSNLVLPGYAQSAVPVHALINKVFIITTNRIGTEANLTFTGMSTIADPSGKVLFQASKDKEEIGLEDIDISKSRNKWITPRNHALQDRRIDFYSELIKK